MRTISLWQFWYLASIYIFLFQPPDKVSSPPEAAVRMAVLHPLGSLYDRPFSVPNAIKDHKAFEERLAKPWGSQEIKVWNVIKILKEVSVPSSLFYPLTGGSYQTLCFAS